MRGAERWSGKREKRRWKIGRDARLGCGDEVHIMQHIACGPSVPAGGRKIRIQRPGIIHMLSHRDSGWKSMLD